jgi:hypothetical protein
MLQQLIYPDILSKITHAFLTINNTKKKIRLDNNRKKSFLLLLFNTYYI